MNPGDAPETPDDPLASIIPAGSRQPTAEIIAERTARELTIWRVETAAGETAATSPSSGGIELPPLPPAPPASTFILRNLIARGGMGEVWEADQFSLCREVAVKRLRPRPGEAAGDTARRSADFEREAFVAANLEHPNILPVHDLGRDAEGLPLLAMKRVRGVSWCDLLDADFRALDEDEFLARHLPILVSMAQAVAFAHARGIVHRDLKPSQVMVGEFGETLLTDWGLAIRIGDTLEFSPIAKLPLPEPATASNPAGTPALMAPEQTEETAAGIGPWTDVFLLGGTLFYLLTETYPYQGTNSRTILRLAQRGVVEDPRDRTPLRRIPDDLAELCNRALAPDPRRRLASAADFVAALQDHLRGSANRARSRALAEEARAALPTARGYAQFTAALSMIDEARNLWPGNPSLDDLRSEALIAYGAAALDAGDLTLARLQAEAARDGGARSGLLARIDSAELSRIRRRRLLGITATGFAIALAAGAAGSAFFSRRIAEKNRLLELHVGENEELVAYMLKDLAGSLKPLGKLSILDGALAKVGEQLDARDPALLTHKQRLSQAALYVQIGEVRRGQGDFARSRDAALASIGVLEKLVDEAGPGEESTLRLSRAYSVLGNACENLREFDKAMAAYEKERGYIAGLLAKDRENEALLFGAGANLDRIGRIHELQGKLDDALACYREDLAIYERLAAKGANQREARVGLTEIHSRIARVHRRRGDLPSALAEYEKRSALLQMLLAENADDWDLRRSLALNSYFMGGIRDERGDNQEALAAYRAAFDMATLLVQHDSSNAFWRLDRLVYATVISGTLPAEDITGKVEFLLIAQEEARRMIADFPDSPDGPRELASNLQRFAPVLRAMDCSEEAVAAAEESFAIYKSMLAARPDDSEMLPYAATSALEIAMSEPDPAIAQARAWEGIDLADRAAALRPEDANTALMRAVSYGRGARAHHRTGAIEAARELLLRSLDLHIELAKATGGNIDRTQSAWEELERFDAANPLK